jgi:hypothetical protein
MPYIEIFGAVLLLGQKNTMPIRYSIVGGNEM